MDIKQILATAIKAAAQKAIDEGTVKGGELPEVLLEVPPQKEFGDFAFSSFKGKFNFPEELEIINHK